MSHLTQMLGLTVHNFVSAATGLAMAFALVRGFRALAAHDGRQFLGRSDPRHALRPAADLVRRRARPRRARRAADARRLGRGDDARGRQADHLDRPGGEPGGDQGARHQWRRLLQRQCRASVREPQRLVQHAGDLGAAGRSPSPRLFAFGRMVGDMRQGRAIARRRWQSCSSSASASPTGRRPPAIRF